MLKLKHLDGALQHEQMLKRVRNRPPELAPAPKLYRWTRERWHHARHIERLYWRHPYDWNRHPTIMTRLNELRDAHPGMTGTDPLDTPLWVRRGLRLGWGDEVPF